MIDNIHLNIEELVLENFPAALSYKVCEIVEQELHDLFQQQTPCLDDIQSYQLAQLSKMLPEISANASVQTVGHEIAIAIFNALTSNSPGLD